MNWGAQCSLFLSLYSRIDYFSFPNLTKWLGSERLDSNDELVAQTNTYFKICDKFYYVEDVKKSNKHWAKRMEPKGEIIEFNSESYRMFDARGEKLTKHSPW